MVLEMLDDQQGEFRSLSHYNDVIMTTMASQITSLTVVYATVYSDADQRKHQNSASPAFVWGTHRDRWFPRTRTSYAENVSIWWRHHETCAAALQMTHVTRDVLLSIEPSCSNNLQWYFNQNSYKRIEENAFWCVICKMATILSLSQRVN